MKESTRENILEDYKDWSPAALRAKRKRIAIVKQRNDEWYTLRSLLGYDWALFYFLLGGREVGKSYAVTNFYVGQWRKYGRPFYWLRLTDASAKKLLANSAEKLIDPDLKRKYDLDITTKGDNVYEVKRNEKGTVVEKKLMARVLSLSTFYNDKGSGLFDKDFLDNPNMYYNICLDEMNREQNEKNSFDIVYAFTNQLENLVRSTKVRTRVICIGNTLEEASDIMTAFNFLPETFGRFKLKSKRAVIDYIEPSEKYLERRKGTVADILLPTASTFTNEIEVDRSLVYKGKLYKPTCIIKFSKDRSQWFTLWNNNVVCKYNKEKLTTLSMRPYIDEFFDNRARDMIIQEYDSRVLYFRDLITAKKFKKELTLLKPRK